MMVVAANGYRMGGPGLALAQLLFLPIILAAAHFDLAGGLVAAVMATTIIGPFALGAGNIAGWDPTSTWLYRAALFILYGATVGTLFQASNRRLERVEDQVGRLSGMYDKVLTSLANTVEVRDRHTQGHCERVARNAVVLGRALGFDDKELEALYWGGMLHDLGKIAVPEYILLKEGRLSEAEYLEIKKHPSYGADLLASVSPEFGQIAAVVRAHHERWDGQGYPRRLKGDQIPLMARVITIVDVFEALTSVRPYRKPMSPGQALKYIRNGAGTQFDPNLVPVFEALYLKGEIQSSAKGVLAEPLAQPSASPVAHITA